MSDAWIPVVYALIAAASSAFAAWIGAKYAVKGTEKKLDLVAVQNVVQTEKIDLVHKDLNGRLEQWRDDVRKYIAAEIKAALGQGKAIGVEQERVRVETKE